MNTWRDGRMGRGEGQQPPSWRRYIFHLLFAPNRFLAAIWYWSLFHRSALVVGTAEQSWAGLGPQAESMTRRCCSFAPDLGCQQSLDVLVDSARHVPRLPRLAPSRCAGSSTRFPPAVSRRAMGCLIFLCHPLGDLDASVAVHKNPSMVEHLNGRHRRWLHPVPLPPLSEGHFATSSSTCSSTVHSPLCPLTQCAGHILPTHPSVASAGSSVTPNINAAARLVPSSRTSDSFSTISVDTSENYAGLLLCSTASMPSAGSSGGVGTHCVRHGSWKPSRDLWPHGWWSRPRPRAVTVISPLAADPIMSIPFSHTFITALHRLACPCIMTAVFSRDGTARVQCEAVFVSRGRLVRDWHPFLQFADVP